MSTYTLNNSAGDIDSALQKVVSATTTPTDASPLMVTSGGVKAYVDTAVVGLDSSVAALQNQVDTLDVVSISTAGASSTTNTNSVAFTTANFVTGVQDAAHNLARASTYIMKTPTGGVSMLSVNISFNDTDDDTNDAYTLTLYIDNTVVAQTTTSSVPSTVYANLCYNSYVFPDKEIKVTFTPVSAASSSGRRITAGSMTCVNYQ
tara:strand:- start:959 stop:1573 length:615 start_codon:yes stop_codon:yes gene_type:complete